MSFYASNYSAHDVEQQRVAKLAPSRIVRHDPITGRYEVFMTGGSWDAQLWRFDRLDIDRSWNSLEAASNAAERIGCYLEAIRHHLYAVRYA